MSVLGQISLHYDEKVSGKKVVDEIKNLPTRTPREKIWKHLVEAELVIDQENLALKEMKKALEIGALVGAKETFLRQASRMGTLIIKAASESPTVYLEDLASAIAERIKGAGENKWEISASLTKREVEVLRHLSTDRPISEIARNLHISINTMKTHLKNLYRKLEVENRNEAVNKAKANFIL